ncbi:hypothetical protein D9M68_321760 [compost metagenome]
MGEQMHARRVHPGEERFLRLRLFLDELHRRGGRLVVDRFHAFAVERAGVLHLAVGEGMQHAARRVGLEERGIVLRPVGPLGLLFGIQVIEVAEELVEAMSCRQEAVLVAEMVLAELPGGIAKRLQRLGDGHVTVLDADGGTGNADLGHAGTQHRLPGDKRGAAGGAAVLRVIVGEQHAVARDPVDIRGLVADDAEGVGADIGLADVVAEDHEDVRLGGILRKGRRCRSGDGRHQHCAGQCQRLRLHRPLDGARREPPKPGLQIDTHFKSP